MCRPRPVTTLTADRAIGIWNQRVDQRRLADPTVADEHATRPASPPGARSGRRPCGSRPTARPGTDRSTSATPGRQGPTWSGTAAGASGVERRHQRAVDQPRPRFRVGERGDHDQLVGVGDDHPLDRVVVVRGPAQRGGALATSTIRARASSMPETSPTTCTRSPTTTPCGPSGRASHRRAPSSRRRAA